MKSIPVSSRSLLIVGMLALTIWLPRGLALDRFVTVDEPSWLTFSANFYQALSRADFARTFQIAHPGVTTTWAGTAAFRWRYPDYPLEVPRQVNYAEQEVGQVLRAHGHDPVEVLATGRAIVVLGITLVLTLAALAAARLIGVWPALLGFLLIAGDPFHIALSRLLHVDALASSLMFLSLLTFLNYLYRGRRQTDLIVSGIAAGLAWLTKAPALFLVPFVGALLLLEAWAGYRSSGRFSRQHARQAAGALLAWGVTGLLVFVLVWPAMWVDPIGSLGAIAREAIGMAKFGHVEAPLYFNGAIVRGDPGWNFYPITYLWRTTPTVLAGLGLAALGFGIPGSRLAEPSQRRVAGVLVLFALLFTLVMTVGAKKFDRYLLPIYAPLDLVAAMGWLALARWLMNGSSELGRRAAPAVIGLAIAGQFAVALPQFPYYLSYYNPLLGGTAKAPRVMMIGWGEGLDQAARYLNAQPDAEKLRVATWFWSGTFSYFFKGQILQGRPPSDITGIRQWLRADYCVLYINQRQRGRLPPELLNYVDGLKPAMVVRIHGLEYAHVYDLRNRALPAHLTGWHLPSDRKVTGPSSAADQSGVRYGAIDRE
jgi:4-amino-4-deoxy-L-arabinose transferase-like glycosyltransferase